MLLAALFTKSKQKSVDREAIAKTKKNYPMYKLTKSA